MNRKKIKTNFESEQRKITLDLIEFDYIPNNINGCKCFLSLNEEQFKKGKYILVNDFVVTSYASINGVMTKFIMTFYDNIGVGYSIGTYRSGNLEMKIEVFHKKTDTKFGIKTGRVTIESKDGRKTVKDFYGECKC
ncbi:MAG: hypothetical protein HYU67_08190 [Flavobacteriia bacterium]|nr:hypothetical protein [Flavobacteriia bacterium]